MKSLILIALTLTCTGVFAQSNPLQKEGTPPITGSVSRTQMTMTGAEMQKMFKAMKIAPGVYNEQGKRIDSVEAVKLTKTFEYGIGLRTLHQDTVYYRVLTKINLAQQAEADAENKKRFAPKNPALQEGAILDLRPFGDRIPAEKVNGKAIVLIFWYLGAFGRADGFADCNDVIANYYDKGKFDVYAVTRYPYDQATQALKISPILNAHHLFDSANLWSIYATQNRNLLIVTDKDHKITYSITGNAGMTPHVLNGLLKAL